MADVAQMIRVHDLDKLSEVAERVVLGKRPVTAKTKAVTALSAVQTYVRIVQHYKEQHQLSAQAVEMYNEIKKQQKQLSNEQQ